LIQIEQDALIFREEAKKRGPAPMEIVDLDLGPRFFAPDDPMELGGGPGTSIESDDPMEMVDNDHDLALDLGRRLFPTHSVVESVDGAQMWDPFNDRMTGGPGRSEGRFPIIGQLEKCDLELGEGEDGNELKEDGFVAG
jgi:hypothetical protein